MQKKYYQLTLGILLALSGWNITSAQTPFLVKDIRPAGHADPQNLTNVNGTLFFAANDGTNGMELWKSDGTSAGTVMVKDIKAGSGGSSPFGLRNVNGTLFFVADDGVNGKELWKSDGTDAGTMLVMDINAGSGGAFTTTLYGAALNGTFYFIASSQLWKTDGTSAGTAMVKSGLLGPGIVVNVNGTLFISTYGDLYKSDGTTNGTVVVGTGMMNGGAYQMAQMNGILYFFPTPTSGHKLWKSDGTTAGTVLVKDISSTASFAVIEMTVVGNTLYFNAKDANGMELWKTDGTGTGTIMVKDINTGSGDASPGYLTNLNGTLIFQASDGTNGAELWKSDGTSAGTVMVSDMAPGGTPSFPGGFVAVGGNVYFSAIATPKGLWKSDGTTAGTVLAGPVNNGIDLAPTRMTNVNGTIFFKAADGTLQSSLWAIKVVVGIDERGLDTDAIVVYPNPGTGKFQLTGIAQFNGSSQVEIYNMQGKKILQQHASNEIDLSASPKGIYLAKFYHGSEVITRKIIIQ